MTVNVQTVDAASVQVLYDTRSASSVPYRHSATGSTARLGLSTSRVVHTVELSGLESATTYYFVAGDSKTGFSAERAFFTAPADDTPIRFVVGGEMGVHERVHKLKQVAVRTEPLFYVLGGDLAYVDGDPQCWETWGIDGWTAGRSTW